ncbi:hypothetical protein S83_044907 [Arachis hypogaea]
MVGYLSPLQPDRDRDGYKNHSSLLLSHLNLPQSIISLFGRVYFLTLIGTLLLPLCSLPPVAGFHCLFIFLHSFIIHLRFLFNHYSYPDSPFFLCFVVSSHLEETVSSM